MKSVALLLAAMLSCSLGMVAKDFKGIVMDSDSVAIELASIAVFANDSVISGGTTDVRGQFRLNVKADFDSIRVSYIGYENKTLTSLDTNPAIIILRKIPTTLKEVVVKAPLIKREADRIVLNVAANPLSANKDAQELLKTAPGVWATDESLSIYGQGNATVYIDDRKVTMPVKRLMAYLRSIQSSSIATIEIISVAGAEYGADSSGGVIRINLKRNRVDGSSGSLGLNLIAGEYKQLFNPFVNVGIHSGKLTVNLNGCVNGSPVDRYNTHEETANVAIGQEMMGESRHKKRNLQGNISLGAFYDLTAIDRIGVQFDASPDRSRHTTDSRTDIYGDDDTGSTSGSYHRRDRSHNFYTSFNWSHTIDDKGSMLKLISNYNRQSVSAVENNSMGWSLKDKDSIYSADNLNRYDIFVTDLSLRKGFSKRWSINVGGKYTMNHVTNRSYHSFLNDGEWISNTRFDYDASYNENIIAIYATANGQAGRWKFKVGIRGEYYKATGDIASDKSLDLFPNVNLSYSLTPNGNYSVALGYYRNIRRPSFWALNPVVRQVSDYTYTVGNPHLTPSFKDAVSLDFLLAQRFMIAAGYSMTDKPIRQMFTSNPDYPGRMYLTWGNEGKDHTAFIHGDGSVKISKRWNLYSGITYVVASQKLNDADSFETFSYLQFVGSTTFILPGGVNLTMNCFYNSRMRIGNITSYPVLNINPTLQKQFGRRWSVSVGVDNMLQRTSRIMTASAAYRRLTYAKSYMTVKAGVTYKFNTGKSFRTPKIEKNTDNSRLSKE